MGIASSNSGWFSAVTSATAWATTPVEGRTVVLRAAINRTLATISTPSGWTLVADQPHNANDFIHQYIWAKTAGPAEPAPTIAASESVICGWDLLELDGEYTLAAETADYSTASGATITFPAATVTDTAMVIHHGFHKMGGTTVGAFTPGTGLTAGDELVDDTRPAGHGALVVYATTETSSTSARDCSYTGSNTNHWVGSSIVAVPVGVTPPGGGSGGAGTTPTVTLGTVGFDDSETGGSQATATLPAHSTGDLLVLFVAADNGGSVAFTNPSGWTKLGEQNGDGSIIGVWSKTAASGSETNPVVGLGAPEDYVAWAANLGAATTIDQSSFAASNTAPAVTTSGANRRVIRFAGSNNQGTHTWSGGGTKIAEQASPPGGVVVGSIVSAEQATAGSSGTATVTPSSGATANTVTIAFAPDDAPTPAASYGTWSTVVARSTSHPDCLAVADPNAYDSEQGLYPNVVNISVRQAAGWTHQPAGPFLHEDKHGPAWLIRSGTVGTPAGLSVPNPIPAATVWRVELEMASERPLASYTPMFGDIEATVTVTAPADRAPHFIAISNDGTETVFEQSVDRGVTWTPVGDPVPGGVPFTSDTTLYLPAAGALWALDEKIYAARIRSTTAADGPLAAELPVDRDLFDTLAAGGEAVDGQGNTWTIVRPTATGSPGRTVGDDNTPTTIDTDGTDDRLELVGDPTAGNYTNSDGLTLVIDAEIGSGAGGWGRLISATDADDLGPQILRNDTLPQVFGRLEDPNTDAPSVGDNGDNIEYDTRFVAAAAFGPTNHGFYIDGTLVEADTSTTVVDTDAPHNVTIAQTASGFSAIAATVYGAAVFRRRLTTDAIAALSLPLTAQTTGTNTNGTHWIAAKVTRGATVELVTAEFTLANETTPTDPPPSGGGTGSGIVPTYQTLNDALGWYSGNLPANTTTRLAELGLPTNRLVGSHYMAAPSDNSITVAASHVSNYIKYHALLDPTQWALFSIHTFDDTPRVNGRPDTDPAAQADAYDEVTAGTHDASLIKMGQALRTGLEGGIPYIFIQVPGQELNGNWQGQAPFAVNIASWQAMTKHAIDTIYGELTAAQRDRVFTDFSLAKRNSRDCTPADFFIDEQSTVKGRTYYDTISINVYLDKAPGPTAHITPEGPFGPDNPSNKLTAAGRAAMWTSITDGNWRIDQILDWAHNLGYPVGMGEGSPGTGLTSESVAKQAAWCHDDPDAVQAWFDWWQTRSAQSDLGIPFWMPFSSTAGGVGVTFPNLPASYARLAALLQAQ